MAYLDQTAFAAALKTQYTQKKIRTLGYEKNPTWAMLPKRTDFAGDVKVVMLQTGTPQGAGIDFGSALANMSASVYNKFLVTRAHDYAFAQISGETIRAGATDQGALVRSLKREMDGAIKTLTRRICTGVFGNSGNARGQISSTSTISSTTITLANISDITNFEKNMVVNLSAADGTSGAKRAGTVTIVAIDRDAGTLTASAAWNTITSAATSDYIFQNGDIEATKSGLAGFGAWVPTTAPTSGDSFFSFDRSQDVTRYAGIRYTTGAGGPIEETLIDCGARVAREGGTPTHVILDPTDWASLAKALSSKVIYDRAKSFDDPDIGFKSIEYMLPTGPVQIVADLNKKQGSGLMLQMDTWCFESLGAAPGILDDDGNQMRASTTSDSYIVRVGYYANLTCDAPGYNAYFTI